MKCIHIIILYGMSLFVPDVVYCQDSTDFIQINLNNLSDSVLFEEAKEYELDPLRLYTDLEINENGYLTLNHLRLYNDLNQAVYLIIDEFVLVDGINYPNKDINIGLFSSFIYLYEEKKEMEFANGFRKSSSFPCYFEIGKERMRWTFSIKFLKKNFREVLKSKGECKGTIRVFYFLEEDIMKIEEELGTTIKHSQIQSRNFHTNFILDFENQHINNFNIFDSNSEKVESDSLNRVFEKYIKYIEVEVKIYDLY